MLCICIKIMHSNDAHAFRFWRNTHWHHAIINFFNWIGLLVLSRDHANFISLIKWMHFDSFFYYSVKTRQDMTERFLEVDEIMKEFLLVLQIFFDQHPQVVQWHTSINKKNIALTAGWLKSSDHCTMKQPALCYVTKWKCLRYISNNNSSMIRMPIISSTT